MKELKKKLSKIENEEDDPLAGDLSEWMRKADWHLVKFEMLPKGKSVTMRFSTELLKEIKAEAKKQGLDYQRFIRLTLERALHKKTG